VPSNLFTLLHNAHHDCLANGEICLQNTCPSVADNQSQQFLKLNAVDCRSRLIIENTLKVEEKVHYFENKCNFSSPPKNAWGTRRDKHTKKLVSNNYAGTLPWKVFIASQRRWK